VDNVAFTFAPDCTNGTNSAPVRAKAFVIAEILVSAIMQDSLE
jgi:hypothetical protein